MREIGTRVDRLVLEQCKGKELVSVYATWAWSTIHLSGFLAGRCLILSLVHWDREPHEHCDSHDQDTVASSNSSN